MSLPSSKPAQGIEIQPLENNFICQPEQTVELATNSAAAGQSNLNQDVKVYNPASTPTPSAVQTPSEIDEQFFEPTISDVQSHHASVLARSRKLNEAPLLTGKYREEEKDQREKRKNEKWPTTTIRVKFSDGTQIQNIFPSSSPIQPVYAFVRSCLDPSSSSKPFTLYQPPKFLYPEHPIPTTSGTAKSKAVNQLNSLGGGPKIVTAANYGPVRGAAIAGLQGGTGGKESLSQLGLVPQSVLLVKWEDDDMNASGYPAPLLPELRQKAEPLPAVQPKEATSAAAKLDSGPKEKKVPKWLQKGLLKKK